MTQSDAARNQSAEAKSGNDKGFAERAQSAGDRNANAANNASGNSSNSGKSK